MNIAFILTMPNNNAWNGKWTGEGNLYAKVENFRGKKADVKAQEILKEKSFYYNFGDGWGASVEVKEVDQKEVRQIRKHSKGFCGYDWMIQEIKDHGKIIPLNERHNKL